MTVAGPHKSRISNSMSTTTKATKQLLNSAPLFAALGDQTRLSLLLKLGEGSLCSITQLAEGCSQTRQAVRKHLRILEDARLVRGVRRGRENLFHIESQTLEDAARSLEVISRQWDDALNRLKKFVED